MDFWIPMQYQKKFTDVFVNLNLPINHLCHFVWTGSLNGTFLAAYTYICIDIWNSLSNNSYIIQVWFHTVIRTATHCNLKFMRKCNLPVAFIKTSVKTAAAVLENVRSIPLRTALTAIRYT